MDLKERSNLVKEQLKETGTKMPLSLLKFHVLIAKELRPVEDILAGSMCKYNGKDAMAVCTPYRLLVITAGIVNYDKLDVSYKQIESAEETGGIFPSLHLWLGGRKVTLERAMNARNLSQTINRLINNPTPVDVV